MGIFVCGILVLLFDSPQQLEMDPDLENPLVQINHRQVYLPMEAIAISSELTGRSQHNAQLKQEEKYILRFNVSNPSSLTSHSHLERSENEYTQPKNN